MLARVQGGTGAGLQMDRRTVPKSGWTCTNGHANIRNAATCLAFGCRERRPRSNP